MPVRSRELDLKHYREPSRELPDNFSFQFRPETEHMMIYGNNVDLQSLKNLGALTRVTRTSFIEETSFGWSFQHQYTVEFSLPVEAPLVLGKVDILHGGMSNTVNYK